MTGGCDIVTRDKERYPMEFVEKAKIMLERWINHNDHHKEEYESFADLLEEAGKAESARYVREMTALSTRSTECLKKALKAL
jgi:hypothetical protein